MLQKKINEVSFSASDINLAGMRITHEDIPKRLMIDLFDNVYVIRIDDQFRRYGFNRDSFKYYKVMGQDFRNNWDLKIRDEVEILVEKYLAEWGNEIKRTKRRIVLNPRRNRNLIVPRKLILTGTKEVVIECDCEWDPEEGLGIKLYPGKIEVGPLDSFL